MNDKVNGNVNPQAQSAETRERPFDKVQDADLSVALWRRDGKHGPYLTSSGVEKTYEDKQTGQIKNTRSLSGSGEHLRAGRLMERASDRIVKFRETMKAERAQSQDRER